MTEQHLSEPTRGTEQFLRLKKSKVKALEAFVRDRAPKKADRQAAWERAATRSLPAGRGQ